jgi:putative PIN family toxin of toxin-antitoxin system
LDEYSNVLSRDFGFSHDEIKKYLVMISNLLNIIEPETIVDAIPEDLADNNIIACAMDGKADYLITYDKHLLRLGSIKGIKIAKPKDFLSLL